MDITKNVRQPETPAARTGDFIQTFTGLSMYPLDPRVSEICIEDIAHALSNICRFTGHVKKFYSVGEHSVRVSQMCKPENALWGLLHDAPEAYLCDMSAPLKRSSELGRLYQEAEARLMLVICVKFGLILQMPHEVDVCDLRMLATERRDLLGKCNRDWQNIDTACYPYEWTIYPQDPESAEQAFLNQYRSAYRRFFS